MDKKSYPHQKLFIAAVAASIFLHLLFSLGVWLHGHFASLRVPPPSVSQNEIELISPEELDRLLRQQQGGQIVDQPEKALNKEVPEDTKYLSRHNQRVVRETRATHTGAFKNSSGAHGQQESGQKPVPSKVEKMEPANRAENSSKKSPIPSIGIDQLKPDFLITRTGVRSEQQIPMPKGAARGDGPSRSDDYLKEVEAGAETLLNTREFVYYSYYTRIKDRLRQYWEPAIKEKVVTLLRQGRMVASVRTRETRLLITLDENGQLVKVQILGQSGIQDLDEAAVEAFKAAAPFPNPPKGIIEKDGTIKIRWDFILEA